MNILSCLYTGYVIDEDDKVAVYSSLSCFFSREGLFLIQTFIPDALSHISFSLFPFCPVIVSCLGQKGILLAITAKMLGYFCPGQC